MINSKKNNNKNKNDHNFDHYSLNQNNCLLSRFTQIEYFIIQNIMKQTNKKFFNLSSIHKKNVISILSCYFFFEFENANSTIKVFEFEKRRAKTLKFEIFTLLFIKIRIENVKKSVFDSFNDEKNDTKIENLKKKIEINE